MSDPARRIVFLGTHGQYNIGDELLLETFLSQLGTQHRYLVNSYDPEFTRTQLGDRFDVEVIDTARDRIQLVRALRHCDLLCFGGGSIIKELYASTGRGRYSTLRMILAIVLFTRHIARKPIAMLNVGVGPLSTRRGLRWARRILRRVDLLTVRDGRSKATCRAIGIDAVASTDAVFSLDPIQLLGHTPPPEKALATGRPLRIGLSLNFDVENPANWENFLTQLALALSHVGAQRPIELHGVPMQTGFKKHDDAEILAAFASRVPSLRYVQHALRTPQDAAQLIATCDLVIAERLHAIVMASILGVPSFVLAYDVKVKELATTLAIEPWSVDIGASFDPRDVGERILALLADRETAADEVSKRSGELRDHARVGFDLARRWVAQGT